MRELKQKTDYSSGHIQPEIFSNWTITRTALFYEILRAIFG